MDAQTVCGGFDRSLIFQTGTPVPATKNWGNGKNTFQRGGMSASFSVWLSRSPPPALEVTGDLY
jgi:hypothetical protein